MSESKSTTIVANASEVKAEKNLDFTSGKDTNIKGGVLSGEKVTGNVGGDLNIESKQDHNSYEEKNSSTGFGIGIDLYLTLLIML
ncbi:hemagglutinin repeat-containing protein [uncultured Phascolarctobacterium sp.]|uniref:hemagglutinin repeat-containing protein n=1 Tax=uncultured Phascolarctobacterium sp. TaxID=512296 RepID=UPI00342936AE